MRDKRERQRGRHKSKSESAGKGSRVEHLTNKQFFLMHFAVVSVKMWCLLVLYIYRSSVADGDVKKRRGRLVGQVKHLIIVRRRRIEDSDRWTGRVKRKKEVPAFCASMHTVNYRLRAYAKACL